MVSLKHYILEIYQNSSLPSAGERRKTLIAEMQELEGKTIHCFTCPGTCCTQAANSMLITPIEALEILHSLEIEKFTANELDKFKEKMQQTITNNRLDVEIYTGKKQSVALRKTYTCPFFNNGSLGCGLSRSNKPYGCLGFNPKNTEDNGKTCASNTELLTDRDNTFLKNEDLVNAKIKSDFKLWWNKQNIPQALLDVLKNL